MPLTPELRYLSRYTTLLRTHLAVDPDDPVEGRLDQRLREAAEAAGAGELPQTLPLIELAEREGLDPLDVDLALFAAAPCLDPGVGALQRALSLDGGPAPTLAQWLRLLSFDAPPLFWSEQGRAGAESAVVRLGLVRPEPLGRGALEVLLRAPDHVVAWLRGGREVGAGLDGALFAEPRVPEVARPGAGARATDALLTAVAGYFEASGLAGALTDRGATLGLVVGPRGAGKSRAVRWACSRLGRPLLTLDGPLVATRGAQEAASAVEAAVAQAAFHREVLLIDEADALMRQGHPAALALQSASRRHRALVMICARSRESVDPALRDLVALHVGLPLPGHGAIAQIWSQAFAAVGPAPLSPERAAERFPLDGRQIVNAALGAQLAARGRAALARAAQAEPEALEVALAAHLPGAAQSQLHEGLGSLGTREPISLEREDLKLPDDVAAQIGEIMAAFRQRRRLYEEWGFGRRIRRGRGIICLFDGEPGTGKSMCAEVLAGSLELSLIRVNTGQIMDKYIGETEKKLAQLFGRAHPGLNLLLFDEADSLFGKRTKVERSNDRYANAAINTLLQLVEGYEGLVVLTTNLKQGIDPAFERRFSYKVSFPIPEADERAAIWRSFLQETPALGEPVDYDYLAEAFELSGGSIKNAVIRAANLALAADSLITMDHLLDACYRELASSGKLVRQDW